MSCPPMDEDEGDDDIDEDGNAGDDGDGNDGWAALVSAPQMWEFFWTLSVCENLQCGPCGILGGRCAVNHCEGVGVIGRQCCGRFGWISLPAVFQGDWQQNNVGGPRGPAVGRMLNVWSYESMERWSVANIFVFLRHSRRMASVTLNASSTSPGRHGEHERSSRSISIRSMSLIH